MLNIPALECQIIDGTTNLNHISIVQPIESGIGAAIFSRFSRALAVVVLVAVVGVGKVTPRARALSLEAWLACIAGLR